MIGAMLLWDPTDLPQDLFEADRAKASNVWLKQMEAASTLEEVSTK
jgi:hypothetical protein